MKDKAISLLASILIGGLVLGIVYGNRFERFDIPFNYGVKDFSNLSIWPDVKGDRASQESFDHIDLPLALLGAKLTAESSYYEGTERLNFPFGFTPIDFPVVGNRGNALLLQTIATFLREPGQILNMFTILSFGFVLLAGWWVLSRITRSMALTVVGAVTIAFLPMHFATEQNFTANYSTMVLGCGLVYRLASKRRVPLTEILITAISLSVFGFYWNLFTLVLLVSALLCAWVLDSREQLCQLFSASAIVLISNFVMFGVDLLPSALFWRRNGVVEGIARLPGFVDSWPFRMLDGLVGPVWTSTVPYFLRRDFFVRGSQQVGEGIYTYGPYGAVALVIALLSLRAAGRNRGRNSNDFFSTNLLVHLLLVTIPLWVGISGFAHLPGVFGLTTVKSWERFQIPAAILSIFVLIAFLDSYPSSRLRRTRTVFVSCSLVLGIIAAVPWTNFRDSEASTRRWDSHSSFFQEVEDRVGSGPVFWLPVELYPEGGYIGDAPPYHSLYGYIFTETTSWNTAATRERYLRWQYDLLTLPTQLFVNRLSDFGFKGFVVDRLARGKGLPAGILDLARSNSLDVLHSRDNRFFFVDVEELFRSQVVERVVVNGVIMSDSEYPF